MPGESSTSRDDVPRAIVVTLVVATFCLAIGLTTLSTSARAGTVAGHAAPTPTPTLPRTSATTSTPAPTATGSPSAHPTKTPAPFGRYHPANPFSEPVGGAALGRSGVVVDPNAPKPPPDVDVRSYLVADLDTGEVLAAKNAHQRLYPASTLKTLTAITLIPRLDKRALYTAVREDADQIGSRVGIEAGHVYTIEQLFYGLFLSSGNDAAQALANASGGTEVAVRLMNEEAARLGAFDTHAVNTSGLDEPGQLSSAYDLALFARAGMANPDFRRYATTPRYDFPGRNGKTYQIQNGNDLLSEYPGAIGVKNGYTTKARNTLIGAAERNGRRLLVVVMKTDAPSWKKVAKLLDWGFEVGAEVEPVGTLVTPEDVERARQALVAARLATAGPTTHQVASPSAAGVTSIGTPTAVVTAPIASRQVAMLPTLVQRVPLWLWVPGVVFVVLASLRVYAYVRARRRAVASPPA